MDWMDCWFGGTMDMTNMFEHVSGLIVPFLDEGVPY